MYSKKFLFSIESPDVLAEAFEKDPTLIWQSSRKHWNIPYLYYLINEEKANLLAVLKPDANFASTFRSKPEELQNILFLAALHAKSSEMFKVLEPFMEEVIEASPNLLIAKNAEQHHPLVVAVRANNVFMVRYLLEKFAQHYATYQNNTLFRQLFMFDQSSVYELALSNKNAEIIELLKQYGADFYTTQNYIPANGLYERKLDNTPYWIALLSERVKQREYTEFRTRVNLSYYLQSLTGSTVEEVGPEEEEQNTQLLNLGIFLEKEVEELDRFYTVNRSSFLNKRIRAPLQSWSEMDMQNLSEASKNRLEHLSWAIYFTAFVFACIYNDQIKNERNDLARDLRRNESYKECMYTTNEWGTEELVSFVRHCAKAPSDFHGDVCKSDPFQSDYRACHSLNLQFIFQTLALIIVGTTFLVTCPERSGEAYNISVRLRITQEVVKSPIYVARYLVGTDSSLSEIPQKPDRIQLYQDLINSLLTVFRVGETYDQLIAQQTILNKSLNQISFAEIKTALATIRTAFDVYSLERKTGLSLISLDTIKPLNSRLRDLPRQELDVERNALSMRQSIQVNGHEEGRGQPNETTRLLT